MDANRQNWNHRQQALRTALKRKANHAQALDLFLAQHAAVHAGAVSAAPGGWSFEEEVFAGLSDSAALALPPKMEHSIAWLLWHVTRCEDITMNLLVAGEDQVLEAGGWLQRTGSPIRDTGNAQDLESIRCFSQSVDLAALREYRAAVGRRTRQVISALPEGAFLRGIDPARLPRILSEGAVQPEAAGLIDYWGSQTVAGLLLMPATRHPFLHWNEALKVKKTASKAG